MWLTFRNKLIANPRFQRWAADFPLTRPIARRNVRDLFDLVAGFVYSQILSACVTLGLFETLAEGPATIAGLAPPWHWRSGWAMGALPWDLWARPCGAIRGCRR